MTVIAAGVEHGVEVVGGFSGHTSSTSFACHRPAWFGAMLPVRPPELALERLHGARQRYRLGPELDRLRDLETTDRTAGPVLDVLLGCGHARLQHHDGVDLLA